MVTAIDQPALSIDADRLWRTLSELGHIGAYYDEATGLTGVCRLALTDADADGRRCVRRWFEEAGLEVRVDRIGNTYGRRAGSDPTLAPVMSGSHIDSVPTGGRFDGALGVIGALEVVRTLNDAAAITRRPIEIGFFTDEEGARFGTDMLGSASAAGRIAVEAAWELADRDGTTVRAELERIGFLGDAPVKLALPYAYVELHIEQGPILAAAGMEVGIVTGVQAISWFEVSITGRAAHAGTTPMELRLDAGLAAARINVKLHEMATSGRYGAGMRATMGRIDVAPNRVNIVPRGVSCTVDLRNPDDRAMVEAERDLAAYFAELEGEMPGVRIAFRQTARTQSVHFSTAVQAVIEKHMRAHQLRYQHILSGAGHDAQELAAICPAGMIFVPGLYDGISHDPRELSTKEACAQGAQLLLETLVELAS